MIPGTRSIAHWKENNATGSLTIAQDMLEKAAALINQQTVTGHRYPEMMRGTIDTEDYA